MLSIRMQRLGRKGYPTYRMVVQDKRQTPTSGKVIAMLGSYNPHTKEVTLDKDVATKFLTNGAYPSPRAVALLKSQGVAIPKWVKSEKKTEKSIKNPEKLRKNQPAEEPKAEEPKEEVVEEAPVETTEATAEEVKTEEAPAEETAPAEEANPEEPAPEAEEESKEA